MEQEMEAIRKSKTWRLTDRSIGRRVLNGKWVYKFKDLEENRNNTTGHKARLCIMGNRQIKGIDFNEMLALVEKCTTIRCIVAMTAMDRWELHQMDVKTAFLHSDLDEEVLKEQPEEYVDATYPDKVCPLLQPLYGLQKALKIWYTKLDAFPKSQGFDNIDAGTCLYLQMDDGEIIIVLVHVDDLLLMASSLQAIKKIKTAHRERFEMKNLGEDTVILGQEISPDKAPGTLKLSQSMYATQVLENFEMVNRNSITMPLKFGLQLTKSEESYEYFP